VATDVEGLPITMVRSVVTTVVTTAVPTVAAGRSGRAGRHSHQTKRGAVNQTGVVCMSPCPCSSMSFVSRTISCPPPRESRARDRAS